MGLDDRRALQCSQSDLLMDRLQGCASSAVHILKIPEEHSQSVNHREHTLTLTTASGPALATIAMSAQQLFAQAGQALGAGAWAKAAALLERHIAHPDTSAAAVASSRVNLGNALCELGPEREIEAERQYRAALKASPSSFEAAANYALFLSERAEPPSTQPAAAGGEQGSGNAPAAAEAAAAAAAMFRRALALNPRWGQGQYNLGNLLAASGAEAEAEALRCYETAARLEPRDADVHNNYALCLAAAGRLAPALEHAKCALGLAPDRADICRNAAELLGSKGEFELALRVAGQACALAVRGGSGRGGGSVGAEAAASLALLASLHEAQGVGGGAQGDGGRAALRALQQCWVVSRGGPSSSAVGLRQRYRYGLRLASCYVAVDGQAAAGARSVYAELAQLAQAQAQAQTACSAAARYHRLDQALFLVLGGQRVAARAVLAQVGPALAADMAPLAAAAQAQVALGCVACVTDLRLPAPVELASKAALARNLAAA
jgi:tetratricopeptide (TPR) repeat protein